MPRRTPPRVALRTLVRTAGDGDLDPDRATLREMHRAGTRRVTMSVAFCVDEAGQVTRVDLREGSGFPAYDQQLQHRIRGWRYRPVLMNGEPTAVCSLVQVGLNLTPYTHH